SMPFGVTILRASAMIPAAFCRLNGLPEGARSAAPARPGPPTAPARQPALKLAAERRKSRRRTPGAGSRTFDNSWDMLISADLEVMAAPPQQADAARSATLQRLCHHGSALPFSGLRARVATGCPLVYNWRITRSDPDTWHRPPLIRPVSSSWTMRK